jgi:hypothetical protein
MFQLLFVLCSSFPHLLQAYAGEADSEPILLALFGLSLFLIASKIRHSISQLTNGHHRLETRPPVIGRMERMDYVPPVHVHTVRSTESIGITRDAVSS